ncbi:hypothetical protein [Methylobacterium gnaphalii]|nr:hypothetical protein [Methylobacterium gnaphalii]GJD67257.1 hypothetical protein MMMDOFMJ_0171 [Methylobacterium gnaphalii]
MAAAYGVGAQTEILQDLGPGWHVRYDEGDLIVSRNIPKEAAIDQVEQKLTEIVLSLG